MTLTTKVKPTPTANPATPTKYFSRWERALAVRTTARTNN